MKKLMEFKDDFGDMVTLHRVGAKMFALTVEQEGVGSTSVTLHADDCKAFLSAAIFLENAGESHHNEVTTIADGKMELRVEQDGYPVRVYFYLVDKLTEKYVEASFSRRLGHDDDLYEMAFLMDTLDAEE